jgi:putative transposase
MRYIELNPVRAGMVAHPRDYAWSSYRANAEGRMDALVRAHSLYRRLAQEDGARQSTYRALVKAPLDAHIMEEIRARTNKGWALGSGRFQSKGTNLTASYRLTGYKKPCPPKLTLCPLIAAYEQAR